MHDPLLRGAEPPNLFTASTRDQAGAVAALRVGGRRHRILQLIQERGSITIFEAAEAIGVGDNQLSGRFSELERDGLIRKSGERRRKPETSCEAEVYVLCGRREQLAHEQLLDRLGWPVTVTIAGETWDRGVLMPDDTLPGVPYHRKADAGGVRITWRLDHVESPCCGRPLFYFTEQIAGQQVKRFKCGRCSRVFELGLAAEPGRGPTLVVVLKSLN